LEKFRFKLSNPKVDIVFIAELKGESYLITWEKNGCVEKVIYKKQDVLDIVKKGGWVIIN
jgi:hypothetical protein